MTTIPEILQAAANADRAGDSVSARMLVQEVERILARPANVDSATGAPMAMAPPRADAPGGGATGPRPNRFGDTTGEAMAAPLAATKAFGAGLMDQSVSPTMAALPESYPAILKRPTAAMGDLAGAGLSALGTGIAGAAGLTAEVVAGDRTQERRMARDLLLGAQVAAPELAGVSGTVRAGGAAVRAAEKASRPVDPATAGARAADRIGVVPSLGATGKTGGMLAAGLEKVPFAGSVIARDAARFVSDVETATTAAVGRIGAPQGAAAAGATLQAGLRDAVARFNARSAELFGKVDQRIPRDARFPISQAQDAVAAAKAAFEGNPELARKLGLNEWDSVMAEAGRSGLSWEAMKRFRSDVGRAIGSNRGALGDEETGRLKQLYGALTADMEAAARQVGGGAFGAWKAASNHYRTGAQRIERSLDATINAENPERAWEAFRALTQEGRSSADIHRMREIKAALKPGEWGTVSASIVDRLGRARAGAQGADGDTFSPAVFLTEWNRLTPEAKSLLLPEDVRAELMDIARVAERVKAANAERNFSNTASAQNIAALAVGSIFDIGAAAATLGGVTLTAKGMTSPMFLRALNRAARGDARQIEAMARGNGPFATDAKTVLSLMAAQQAGQPANSDALRRIAN